MLTTKFELISIKQILFYKLLPGQPACIAISLDSQTCKPLTAALFPETQCVLLLFRSNWL